MTDNLIQLHFHNPIQAFEAANRMNNMFFAADMSVRATSLNSRDVLVCISNVEEANIVAEAVYNMEYELTLLGEILRHRWYEIMQDRFPNMARALRIGLEMDL